MFLRTIIMATALVALSTAPASAAELKQPLKACYVVAQENQRETIAINAVGFTPFSSVDVFVDEVLQDQPRTLFDGSIEGTVRAPWQEEGQRSFQLRIAEPNVVANTITTSAQVTRLAVTQTPGSARTNDHVRFRGRGFTTPGVAIYAHYVFAGKARKTVKLGMPQGPCGTFNVKRKQFPFKGAPTRGVWTIQFDQVPYYDANAAVRVPMTIKVRRAPKQ